MAKLKTVRLAVLLGSLVCASPVRGIVIGAGNPATTGVASYGQTVDGSNLSGVVEITSSMGLCTGSLLSNGASILTAGHCVTSAFGSGIATNITVYFQGPGGPVAESVSNVQVDPGYTGDSTHGYDLAVLTLSQPAPAFATGYSLFTTSSPVLSTPVVIAGYGYGGTGDTGANSSAYPFGTLRAGENEYEGNGQQYFDWSSSLLIGQFYESGVPSTNALSVTNPYSSADEVDIAHGDSGGPTFSNGEIIGVHDLVICSTTKSDPNDCAVPPSVNSANNSYFGEMFADTSVADNLAFIEGAEAPEPGTGALLFCAMASAAWLRLRKMRV